VQTLFEYILYPNIFNSILKNLPLFHLYLQNPTYLDVRYTQFNI